MIRRALFAPLAIAALAGGGLGFAVARNLAPNPIPETVSVIQLPATPTPDPTASPTPGPTADVQISDGRGTPGCPAGCECQHTGSGVIIRCTGN